MGTGIQDYQSADGTKLTYDQVLERYFAPGAIRPAFGGQDRTLAFDVTNYAVTAQAVDSEGKPLPGFEGRTRTHGTLPAPGSRELNEFLRDQKLEPIHQLERRMFRRQIGLPLEPELETAAPGEAAAASPAAVAAPEGKPARAPGSDYAREVASVIIDQLRRGTAPWTKPWEPGQGPSRPFNPSTGKEYRGANALWLMVQATRRGLDDSRWMTFRQAQTVGASVRKGEKGTRIQYWQWSGEEPVLDEETGLPKKDEKGEPITQRVDYERPRVFTAVVFNAAQIDGLPPPEKRAPPPEWERHQRAEGILSTSGASISHAPGDRAYYNILTDQVVLPERTQFKSGDSYYAVALHELAHWTGASSRLDRNLSGSFGTEAYAREELRAEIASFMLGDRLAIGHDPANHASYVASWIKSLEEDPREIFRAAGDAEKIASYLQQYDRTVEQQKTAEGRAPGDVDVAGRTASESPNQKEADMMQYRVNLEVSFKDREAAKAAGARWDKGAKVWFAPKGADLTKLAQWMPAERTAVTVAAAAGPAVMEAPPAEKPVPTQGAASAQAEQAKADRRFDLEVSFKDRDAAKAAGARWDKYAKVWFAPKGADFTKLAQWMPAERTAPAEKSTAATQQTASAPDSSSGTAPPETKASAERTYIAVPYKEKDDARKLGARWDRGARSWFVPPGLNTEAFAKWMGKSTELPDPFAEFGQALRTAGLKLPDNENPQMDGQWHRLPVEGDKSGEKSGAYRGYSDGRPAGFIENHKAGTRNGWKSHSPAPTLTDAERARLAEETKEHRREQSAAREQQYDAAAAKARQKWEAAPASWVGTLHPYLERKDVPAYGVRVAKDGALLVPLHDTATGQLVSVQSISADGRKSFEKGGRVSGASFRIDPHSKAPGQGPSKTLVIAEGYATGATVARALGLPTYVAFNASNLVPVAKELRKQYPEAMICVAADNDHKSSSRGNPGRDKAQAAAKAVGGHVLLPEFDKGDPGTDWNDLEKKAGRKAMRDALEERLAAAILLDQARVEVEKLVPPSVEQTTPTIVREAPERDFRQHGSWDGR